MRLKRTENNYEHTYLLSNHALIHTDSYLCLGVAGEHGGLYGYVVMNWQTAQLASWDLGGLVRNGMAL